MRGGKASTPACGRNASDRLPPSGLKENANATTKSSRDRGAQRPRVALRDAGARQVAGHCRQPLSHAFLVLVPQRVGEHAVAAARPVGLHRDGIVLQPVGGFDAPVDLNGGRLSEEPQRIESGERGQPESDSHNQADRCPASTGTSQATTG